MFLSIVNVPFVLWAASLATINYTECLYEVAIHCGLLKRDPGLPKQNSLILYAPVDRTFRRSFMKTQLKTMIWRRLYKCLGWDAESLGKRPPSGCHPLIDTLSSFWCGIAAAEMTIATTIFGMMTLDVFSGFKAIYQKDYGASLPEWIVEINNAASAHSFSPLDYYIKQFGLGQIGSYTPVGTPAVVFIYYAILNFSITLVLKGQMSVKTFKKTVKPMVTVGGICGLGLLGDASAIAVYAMWSTPLFVLTVYSEFMALIGKNQEPTLFFDAVKPEERGE
jgi:hypothetical protein